MIRPVPEHATERDDEEALDAWLRGEGIRMDIAMHQSFARMGRMYRWGRYPLRHRLADALEAFGGWLVGRMFDVANFVRGDRP